MSRLKMIGSQVSNLQPAVSMLQRQQTGGSWQRENPEERAFYKTARWQRLRWAVLARAL